MNQDTPSTWPDLAASAVEKLARIYEEITYELVNMEVTIPGGTGPATPSAVWKFNGTLKIRAKLTNP